MDCMSIRTTTNILGIGKSRTEIVLVLWASQALADFVYDIALSVGGARYFSDGFSLHSLFILV
jgi:hypothetical protein